MIAQDVQGHVLCFLDRKKVSDRLFHVRCPVVLKGLFVRPNYMSRRIYVAPFPPAGRDQMRPRKVVLPGGRMLPKTFQMAVSPEPRLSIRIAFSWLPWRNRARRFGGLWGVLRSTLWSVADTGSACGHYSWNYAATRLPLNFPCDRR
jgi:hypothetical protein